MNLDRDGAEVREGVLSPTEVEEWIGALSEIVSSGPGQRNLAGRSGKLAELCGSEPVRALLPERKFILVRSILFDKNPVTNWPVAWHQNKTISVREKHDIDGFGPWSVKDGVAHVQPPESLLESMVTIRLHLDPTPKENGALMVIPGSHIDGILSGPDLDKWKTRPAKTLDCRAGDAVLLKPLTLHSSRRSGVPAFRRSGVPEIRPDGESCIWNSPRKRFFRRPANGPKRNARGSPSRGRPDGNNCARLSLASKSEFLLYK